MKNLARMTKKTAVLCLVLLGATAALGVAYGTWTQPVYVDPANVSIAATPLVATDAPDAIVAPTVTLKGHLSQQAPGDSAVSVYFQYGPDAAHYGAPVSASPATVTTSNPDFTYGLAVTADQTYYYRAMGVGFFTVYGGDQYFTATAPIPPAGTLTALGTATIWVARTSGTAATCEFRVRVYRIRSGNSVQVGTGTRTNETVTGTDYSTANQKDISVTRSGGPTYYTFQTGDVMRSVVYARRTTGGSTNRTITIYYNYSSGNGVSYFPATIGGSTNSWYYRYISSADVLYPSVGSSSGASHAVVLDNEHAWYTLGTWNYTWP